MRPSLQMMQKEIYQTAVEKGWWETDREMPEAIALMHSELSEALEAWRHGSAWNVVDGKPEGWVTEFADCIIRILDVCEHHGADMEWALLEKMKYNWTRPYRHGGLRA